MFLESCSTPATAPDPVAGWYEGTLYEDKPFYITKNVTAQDSCDMRDRLLRYFATCGQEKPLSGSLKRGEKNA